MKQYCVWIACAGVNRGGDGFYVDADGEQVSSAVPMLYQQALYFRKFYGARCEITEF